MYEGSNQMSEHKNNKLFHMPGKPSKKVIIAIVCVLALAAIAFILVSSGIAGRILGSGNVSFTPLDAKDIPRAIEKDVIPEYRELERALGGCLHLDAHIGFVDRERALGCVVDGKVYIVVTRGEKPTAGYDLSIEKVNLEKTGDGSNLVVTAKFTDPPQGKTVSRVITYPYEVASTDLKGLPDTIELNVRYA